MSKQPLSFSTVDVQQNVRSVKVYQTESVMRAVDFSIWGLKPTLSLSLVIFIKYKIYRNTRWWQGKYKLMTDVWHSWPSQAIKPSIYEKALWVFPVLLDLWVEDGSIQVSSKPSSYHTWVLMSCHQSWLWTRLWPSIFLKFAGVPQVAY